MGNSANRRPVTVGIYCDLGRSLGAGHLVRSCALGAALVRAGVQVEVVADFADVPWTRKQARDLSLRTLEGADPVVIPDLAARRGWAAVVVDSYRATATDVDTLAVPLAAVDDEDRRPLPASLVINQNLSAAACSYSSWPATTVLRGPTYALLRPRITAARPAHYVPRDWTGRSQRVLVMLGGTDAGNGVTAVARWALEMLTPVELCVVTGTSSGVESVRALRVPDGSTLRITEPVLDIEQLMTWADLVISGAGSTAWELCCLGIPMALVPVAENQLVNYHLMVEAGIAVGLGPLARFVEGGEIDWSRATPLRTPAINEAGRRGWETVDGFGADRVAQAILALADEYRRPAGTGVSKRPTQGLGQPPREGRR